VVSRTCFFLASVFLCLSLSSRLARAEVTQPSGLVVPRDSDNGETQLYSLFSSRGEAIDFIADGRAEPATFSPLCDFRATFVLHEAGSNLGVGWYNADPAATTAPSAADIQVIVPPGSAVGTMIASEDIRSSPAYRGGAIGFALLVGPIFYTEARYNPVCTGCSPPGPWIMAVVYRSTATPNAYYVAFEDGNVGATPAEFNNDGDYNDYVYFFEGLACAAAGAPCETGMMGICNAGLTECNAGAISCRPSLSMRDEACNGLDDDCDGAIDDAAPCPEGEICDRGACVGRCMGEFGCAEGLECSAAGLCVEAACVGISCAAGEICRAGACAGPCAGVVCPGDRECRAGRCVDPCAGVTCEAGRACDRGVCTDRCECSACAPGLACDAASGVCAEAACIGVTCAAGEVCRSGACIDGCTGAECPRGQICESGECIADPTFGIDAGAGGVDGGRLDGGGAGIDGGRRRGGSDGGCSCRAVGGGRGWGSNAMMLLAALGLVITARRARRASDRASSGGSR
jgi:hypothetical protein